LAFWSKVLDFSYHADNFAPGTLLAREEGHAQTFSQGALAGPKFGRENIVHNYDRGRALTISAGKIPALENRKPHHLKKAGQNGFLFYEQWFPKERGLRICIHAVDQGLAR
jgi:hypothetical protein